MADLHHLAGVSLAPLGYHALHGHECEHVVGRSRPLLGLEPPAAPCVLGGGDADDTVVLREGELVLHRAVDPSGGHVGSLGGVTDVEYVDVGGVIPTEVAPEPPPVVCGLCEHHDVL